MIGDIVLDYTKVAPPLSAAAVLADIDCHKMQSCRTPHKIVMWAHQWLWLCHAAGMLKEDTRLPWEEVPAEGVVVGDNTLWGIPVEVREP